MSLIQSIRSLDEVLDCTTVSPPPYNKQDADEVVSLYHRIISDCEKEKLLPLAPWTDHGHPDPDPLCFHPEVAAGVSVHSVLKCAFEYAPTAAGGINFVRMILHGLFPPHDLSMGRSLDAILLRARAWHDYSPEQKSILYTTLSSFATDLLKCFFVPLQGQAICTSNSGLSVQNSVRKLCLRRDAYRCIVTNRSDTSNPNHRRNPVPSTPMSVCHIIPPTLNNLNSSCSAPTKHLVWRYLNMFDPGVSDLLSGTLINGISNAFVVLPELHMRFERLEWYLSEVEGKENTYSFCANSSEPFKRYLTPHSSELASKNRGGELPSSRLLRLHKAVCLMISMAGAEGYVERLAYDTEVLLEARTMANDGSDDLSLLMRLKGVSDEREEKAEAEESEDEDEDEDW